MIKIRAIVSKWMLTFIVKHNKELLVNYITEQANEVAMRLTMIILDKEGLAHCRFCPSRFSLRSFIVDGIRKDWICEAHDRLRMSGKLDQNGLKNESIQKTSAKKVQPQSLMPV